MAESSLLSLSVAALVLACPGQAQLTFVNEAPALGLDAVGYGRGAAWVDLDGDGLYDIVDTSAGTPTMFWRRRPDGTYEDAGAAWGIAPVVFQTWGVLAGDLDNDGDADLAFPNGGFGAIESNRLLINELDVLGKFCESGSLAGDFEGQAAAFGGALLDYDRDGDLDLFVSNLRFAAGDATCTLLRNDLELGGGVQFTDVSSLAGITDLGAYLHCSAGDFDNDGWIDVGVANMTGANRLYRNQGDGTFLEVAASVGVDSPTLNFGFVLEDFDNDGWLDVFLPKYQLDPAGPSELYHNDGSGGFVDVTATSGLTGQTDMGHNTGDVDGDGYPDIYIGTGSPQAATDDVLYRMQPVPGGLTAVDVSLSSGILSQGPTRLHGIAFADDDGDGDLDVFANNGGPSTFVTSCQENFFWRNQGTGAHWFAVDLRGRVSNRDAVGARAAVLLASGTRVFRRRAVGRGFANSDAPTVHFGLGPEPDVVALELDWPSGIRQIVSLEKADQRISIAETGILLVDPAEVGGSFSVLAVGDPGGRVDLSVGMGGTPLGRGAVELALPLGGLTLDAAGLTTHVFAVPADPGLTGVVWSVQATFTDSLGGTYVAPPLGVTIL